MEKHFPKAYWALRLELVRVRKGVIWRKDQIIGTTSRVGTESEIKEIHEQIIKIFSKNGISFRSY